MSKTIDDIRATTRGSRPVASARRLAAPLSVGLLGLVISLISDLAYMWVDPRIDFESRQV